MNTRIIQFFTVSAISALICGCMTSRSICTVEYENNDVVISSSAEVTTLRKYEIREIRYGSCASSLDDSVIGEVAGSIASKERVMHTCPGVFERNGKEIFVDLVSFSKDSSRQWTAVPCFLTVGICPYFQKDVTTVTAEVSLVSDPAKKARFSYRLVDDWKISFLFQLGAIPYSSENLKNVRIGKRGYGDVSAEIHQAGFAVGVAKALKELERMELTSSDQSLQ